MAKLKFFDVDEDYMKYLQNEEPKVPNHNYENNKKFFCGVVLEINGYNYFAPLSSKTPDRETNFLIYDKAKCIASVNFKYMIPVPKEYLIFKDFSKEDPKYMRLLKKEHKYCNQHKDEIYRIAKETYDIGINKDHELNKICCDFKKLEELQKSYVIEKNLQPA